MKTLLPLIGIAWIIISCSTENDLDYYTTLTEMEQTVPKNNIDLEEEEDEDWDIAVGNIQ